MTAGLGARRLGIERLDVGQFTVLFVEACTRQRGGGAVVVVTGDTVVVAGARVGEVDPAVVGIVGVHRYVQQATLVAAFGGGELVLVGVDLGQVAECGHLVAVDQVEIAGALGDQHAVVGQPCHRPGVLQPADHLGDTQRGLFAVVVADDLVVGHADAGALVAVVIRVVVVGIGHAVGRGQHHGERQPRQCPGKAILGDG